MPRRFARADVGGSDDSQDHGLSSEPLVEAIVQRHGAYDGRRRGLPAGVVLWWAQVETDHTYPELCRSADRRRATSFIDS